MCRQKHTFAGRRVKLLAESRPAGATISDNYRAAHKLTALCIAACFVTSCSKALPPKEFCESAQEAQHACMDEWMVMLSQIGPDAVGCPKAFERFQPIYEASRNAAHTNEGRTAIETVYERFRRFSEVSLKPNTSYLGSMECQRVSESLQ